MQTEQKNRSKTNHLSVGQIKNLKEEYYSGKSTKSLIDKYNIDIPPSSLHTTFPLVYTPDELCKYCKAGMYFVPPPKNAQNRKIYLCTTCLHKESLFGCNCRQCISAKYEEKREDEIREKLKRKRGAVNTARYLGAPSLSSLSIQERVYLGALLRTHLSFENFLVDLGSSSAQVLAPTLEYRDLILNTLLSRNIIAPHKLEGSNGFHGTLYDVCIFDRVKNKEEMIANLMYPQKIPPEEEVITLHLLADIQQYEATEYMLLTIKQFNLCLLEVEQKFGILFSRILIDFSTGQLFNFIYVAVRNLAAHKNKNKYVSVANYIYKSIADRYKKSLTSDWKITNFNRPYGAQRTELSKITNDRLLRIGDLTFYQKLSLELLAD